MTTPNNEFEGTNMSKEEFIKSEIDKCSQQISNAKVRIAELRKGCPHTETFKGLWSWREGAYHDAILCSICGGLVELTPLNGGAITVSSNHDIRKMVQTTAKRPFSEM